MTERKTTAVATRDKPPAKLTEKQRAFVHEYVFAPGRPRERFNATAAARAAGYGKCERRKAYELLRVPKVAAEVKRLIAEMRTEQEAIVRRAVEELMAAAFARLDDFIYINESGRIQLKDPSEIPQGAWAGLAEIAETEDGIRVKLQPKSQTVATLLRAVGHGHDGPRTQVAVGVTVNNDAQPRDGLTRDDIKRVRDALGIPMVDARAGIGGGHA